MSPFTEPIARFGLNFLVVFIIVRFIYFPKQKDRNYVFTYFAINTVVFLVIGLFNISEISVGAAFGMFATISILRFRTDTLPIREMTYLFVVIALPVVNSMLLWQGTYEQMIVGNIGLILILFVLERGWGFRYEARKSITYERIDLIRPENWGELMQDLKTRTGLPIKRIEIGRVNFLRDTAELNIYYETRGVETDEVKVSTSQSTGSSGAGE